MNCEIAAGLPATVEAGADADASSNPAVAEMELSVRIIARSLALGMTRIYLTPADGMVAADVLVRGVPEDDEEEEDDDKKHGNDEEEDDDQDDDQGEGYSE